MSGGQNRAIKDQAWAFGKDLMIDLDAWLDDKWGQPYGVKLSTIAYDARNNTTTLNRYNSAEAEMIRLNEELNNLHVKKGGGMADSDWLRVKNLIARANIALPHGMDITEGSALFRNRPVGGRKEFDRQRQKTYRSILEHVAILMEEVNRIYSLGMASIRSKTKDQYSVAVEALEMQGFMKAMRGYSQGVCHIEIHKNLSAKIEKVMHG